MDGKYHVRNISLIIIALLIFSSGIGIGVVFNKPKCEISIPEKNSELHKDGRLTSPLLECNTGSSIGSMEFSAFEKNIRKDIDDMTVAGKVTHVSVYLRHLLDGAWIGINENEKFTPASLLKVPNMISLLKMSENDPNILTKELVYDTRYFPGKPYFAPDTSLEIGKKYTVDDMIARMIKDSDNEAMFTLRANFDASFFNKLYDDLKITAPNDNISDDFMTVKTYASFFRILYNSSYLSTPLSEKALQLLTNTGFDNALTAGIPKNITIAHKFGERTYINDETKQLHDCGIIYRADEPYLLCVMTRGKDFDVLAGVIKDISKSVWDEFQIRASETKTPDK
jgi:beta-lactamase class A